MGITAAAILLNAEVESGEQILGLVALPRIKNVNLTAAAWPLAQLGALGLALAGLVAGRAQIPCRHALQFRHAEHAGIVFAST